MILIIMIADLYTNLFLEIGPKKKNLNSDYIDWMNILLSYTSNVNFLPKMRKVKVIF